MYVVTDWHAGPTYSLDVFTPTRLQGMRQFLMLAMHVQRPPYLYSAPPRSHQMLTLNPKPQPAPSG